jgi:hypothetical protein
MGLMPTYEPTWDQVLTFGEYQHVTVNGDPVMTVFDASKCRFMLDDFERRKNDIFVDKRHEVVEALDGDGNPLDLDQMQKWAEDGRALAWADALVMVVASRVVKYVRHASAPSLPPSLDELRRPDGSMPEDGVYARRFQVTPLGADPKEGLAVYRYTSPYFVPEKDGWRLLNYTATNDPRMEGVALGQSMQAMQSSGRLWMGRQAMSRTTKDTKMADDKKPDTAAIMKAAGIMESDGPEEKLAKMTAYAYECGESRRKAEDEAGAMKRKMEEDEEKRAKMESEDEEKRAAARKAEDKPFAGKETPEEEKKEHEAMQAMRRENKALQSKLGVLETQLDRVTKLLPNLEAQAKKSRELEAREWAHKAISMGRYPGDAEGDLEKTISKLASEHVADPEVAAKMLFAEGKFKPSEAMVMQQMTRGGAGIGAPQPREAPIAGDDLKANQRAYDAAITMANKRLRAEGKTPTFDAAAAIVAREQPELAKRVMEGA